MREFKGFKKGINLGGWISQFDKYDKAHFDSFITEDDIDNIAGMGFDHVRVPVDYNLFEEEDGTEKTDGFYYLDLCEKWCAKNNLHMIIDLHECYGYSFDPLKKDLDRERFFHDEEMMSRFLNLWERIAKRYGDKPDMIAFEPLNEVVPMNVVDEWNALLNRYIKLIRSIAPDTYLIIGGVCYNSVISVPLLDIDVDDKTVYNFHCYEPLIYTHQGAYWIDGMKPDFRVDYPHTLAEYREAGTFLTREQAGAVYEDGISEIGEGFFEDIFRPALEKAEKDGIPLYCGEYGVIDLAAPEGRLRWLRDIHAVFNRHGIGRSLWNYKEKDFGLVDSSFDEIKDKFIEIL